MDAILSLAGMVFKENLRKKVIQVFLIIAVVIFVWAGTFNVFSLGVQVKFLKDISLFAISVIGMLITLTTTAGQLSNEIQTRTIYPLMAKPVSRFQILAGKFLGAIYVIYLNLIILAVIFLGLLYYRQHFIDTTTAQAIYLIGVECAVTASMCLFFSTFFSTAANVCTTFMLYIIGHLKMDYGTYLSHQLNIPGIGLIVKLLQNPVFPVSYDYFSIKDAMIAGIPVPQSYMVSSTLYGLLLVLIYLITANWIFTQRDL